MYLTRIGQVVCLGLVSSAMRPFVYRPGALVLLGSSVAGLFTWLGVYPPESHAQARWRLSVEPTIVIGSSDGAPAYTFDDIRGVVTTTEGLIVVADGTSRELRVFSSTGEFVRSFGRVGDGPKEFRGIGWIDMCGGDAVVAYDIRRTRVTKWDTQGSLLDEFRVEGPANSPPYTVSCGPSGKFVVIGWPQIATRPRGPYRPRIEVGIADERGRRESLVGVFPGTERIRTEYNDLPHPFGRETVARMGAGGVYVGTADSFGIDLITTDGRRRTLIREHPIEALSREVRERWVESLVVRAPADQRPSLKRRFLESEWLPEVAPAYAGFQIDQLGFVWVEPYVIEDPAVTVPLEWSVFHPGGVFVATVPIPGNFHPTEIGGNYVLGVSVDPMGVERVHRYTLTRRGRNQGGT